MVILAVAVAALLGFLSGRWYQVAYIRGLRLEAHDLTTQNERLRRINDQYAHSLAESHRRRNSLEATLADIRRGFDALRAQFGPTDPELIAAYEREVADLEPLNRLFPEESR